MPGACKASRLDSEFGPSQLSEVGNFSMSYNMLKTAFDGNGDATFAKFLENIPQIQNRLTSNLAAKTNQDITTIDGYNGFGQDVLLPAFAAAYAGGDFLRSLCSIQISSATRWVLSRYWPLL